jgi:hypothetical protein
LDERRNSAEFQIAATRAKHARKADQGAQTAAVQIADLAQFQQVFLRFQAMLFHFLLQQGNFVTNHNPAAAPDHGHSGQPLRLQCEAHGIGRSYIKDACVGKLI